MIAALLASALSCASSTPALVVPPTTAAALADAATTAPDKSAPPTEQEALAEPATKRTKLLVLDVKSADLEPAQAETLTAFIAARAARFASLEVVSTADLRELADVQADKAALGCDTAAAACMAELANALDAQLVLSTRAGKLDAVTVVTLQLFDTRNTAAEGRASVQGWSLPEVTEKLGPALDEVLHDATGDSPTTGGATSVGPGPRPTETAPIATGLVIGGGIGAGVGVVVGVLGAAPAILYGQKKAELTQRTVDFDGSQEQLNQAARLQREAADLRQLYDGVGRFGLMAGLLLAPLGAAAVTLGVLWPMTASGGAE